MLDLPQRILKSLTLIQIISYPPIGYVEVEVEVEVDIDSDEFENTYVKLNCELSFNF